MAIVLSILDVLVVLGVVIGVSRAVWNGGKSRILSGFIIAAMIIFGVVSFTAANGLTSASPFNEWALFIALVAIAILVRSALKSSKLPLREESAVRNAEPRQASTIPSRP